MEQFIDFHSFQVIKKSKIAEIVDFGKKLQKRKTETIRKATKNGQKKLLSKKCSNKGVVKKREKSDKKRQIKNRKKRTSKKAVTNTKRASKVFTKSDKNVLLKKGQK